MKKSRSLSIPCLIGGVCLLTSCAMYQQEFECPPPKGVPCTSETDLESMVLETKEGADLFLPPEQKDSCCQPKNVPTLISGSPLKRKVWICHPLIGQGCCAQGHYVYPLQDLVNPLTLE